ncbi:MAG: phosphoglycerate dehydrogenase [Oscillospiraceae bacterium]|nr:phosphoglycerate dehydrogenase [Oscillospiraceae bacterium]
MVTVKKFNKISDIVYTQMPQERYRFIEEGEDYDLALVRSAQLHETIFPKKLLAIARAGAGVNNLPVERCSEEGIVVFNTPGANANAVKELVLCGMMLACRRIVPGIQWVEQQRDEGAADVDKRMEKAKKDFVGGEIAGKTLGVIGLGAIGVMVANAAVALGMEVIGYDPFLSVDAALRLSRSVKLAKTQEELLGKCDFLTLHLPQTEKTKGMINESAIAAIKPGAVLLNFARGGLIDDEAVLAALDAEILARYVTDFPNDRIIRHPKVIAMPHLGASTPEAEENCARMAAAQLEEYLVNGNIKNSVNFPDCEYPRGEGWRIAIINKNVTNMMGQITAVLAQRQFNIEHMLNHSRGPWAYTLIDLLEQPDPACADALAAIDGVVRVRVIGGNA